ncbi:hypothetical protein FBU59_001948 [Linderina macrospora]|uniref:Uncharacterized protein n=1 Tax=Linderina macrospora TaxID=4868 RepID=A0ACC1JCU7_9FUNG|nr:hypothetical protein FBU59_001948 [Linderina macrospora]
MSSNASTFRLPDIRSTIAGSTINVAHISTKHTSAPQTKDMPHAHVPPTIVVHGGIIPSSHPLPPHFDALIRRSLKKSLEAGYRILLNGGTAVHAVEAAVRTLEDNKLFSAGRGAPISSTGHPILDATICDGRKQRAASAACVSTIPNPIALARKILDSGKMTTACSKTADILAEEFEMPQIDPAQLITEHRVNEHQSWQVNKLGASKYLPARVPVQAAGRRRDVTTLAGGKQNNQDIYPSCGVGAVAIDSRGKVAAASSSGGVIGRKGGQIGECGCIGASAWADSQVAISGVSTHDLCICQQTAHTIALRARYRQRTLESAAVSALTDLMISTGADGAFVTIDSMGKFAMVFSADSMIRGFCSVKSNHEPVVAIGAGERISSGDIHLT